MKCQRCDSTQFDEYNGLYYCCFCQTQSQGFTQEIADKYTERAFTKEVGEKKVRQRVERKAGVLWTTTEAFNIILNKQMLQIISMDGIGVNAEAFKSFTSLIWFTYLRCSDIAFRDNTTEDDSNDATPPPLHPASRFRDQQIFKNRVNHFLPKYKNANTELGFNNWSRLGSDAVFRYSEDSDSLLAFDYNKSSLENDYDLNDIFYDKYSDPRIYAKRRQSELKISKESKKQLRELLSKMDLKTSFRNTIDLMSVCDEVNDDIDRDCDEVNDDIDRDCDEVNDDIDRDCDELLFDKSSPKKQSCDAFCEPECDPYSDSDSKDKKVDDLDDWFENNDNYDDYDKQLMRNLTKSTQLYSKLIPLSYLKKSKYIATDYFIDLMSLPKTLSILNIVIRLLNYNIYGFDLIRWASEGSIPYLNCLTCFPEDWEILSNDFHTFTSSCVPSSNTLNVLTAKIAKHIKINSFPRPHLKSLLKRFVKDLNLPKGLVQIIDSNYNLFEHFPHKLQRKSANCKQMYCLPFYERWALMAIVIVLKRIFVLDDKTEKCLSDSAKNIKDIFIWDDWEKFTRLRFELIKSYYMPLYGRYFEDIRDVDVFAEHALKRTAFETKIYTDKKANFKEFQFRADVQKDFRQYLSNEDELSPMESPNPSLYPLRNATEFILTRMSSPSMVKDLSVNFEDKLISPWVCSHANCFHRGYKHLNIGNAKRPNNIKSWSSSFKLLIELSSIILHCHYSDLFFIINEMEKIYFGTKIRKSY